MSRKRNEYTTIQQWVRLHDARWGFSSDVQSIYGMIY